MARMPATIMLGLGFGTFVTISAMRDFSKGKGSYGKLVFGLGLAGVNALQTYETLFVDEEEARNVEKK